MNSLTSESDFLIPSVSQFGVEFQASSSSSIDPDTDEKFEELKKTLEQAYGNGFKHTRVVLAHQLPLDSKAGESILSGMKLIGDVHNHYSGIVTGDKVCMSQAGVVTEGSHGKAPADNRKRF